MHHVLHLARWLHFHCATQVEEGLEAIGFEVLFGSWGLASGRFAMLLDHFPRFTALLLYMARLLGYGILMILHLRSGQSA